VLWQAGRMVLTPAEPGAARGETSGWMVAAMGACLVVVIGLGFHLPSGLAALLQHAAGSLGVSG